MEKEMFKQYDSKEFMRAAILKQDQTFKQQVQELHRLYRTQKVLMSGIQTNNNQLPNHRHTITSQPIILAPDSDKNGGNMNIDAAGTANSSNGRLGMAQKHIEEEEIELTLGPSTYNSSSSSSDQEKRIKKRAVLIGQKAISGATSGRQSPSSASSSSTTGSSGQNKRRLASGTESSILNQQNGRSRPRYPMMSLLGGGLNGSARVLRGGGSSSQTANMSFQSSGIGGNIKTNNHGGEHLRQQAWFLDQALSLKLT